MWLLTRRKRKAVNVVWFNRRSLTSIQVICCSFSSDVTSSAGLVMIMMQSSFSTYSISLPNNIHTQHILHQLVLTQNKSSFIAPIDVLSFNQLKQIQLINKKLQFNDYYLQEQWSHTSGSWHDCIFYLFMIILYSNHWIKRCKTHTHTHFEHHQNG